MGQSQTARTLALVCAFFLTCFASRSYAQSIANDDPSPEAKLTRVEVLDCLERRATIQALLRMERAKPVQNQHRRQLLNRLAEGVSCPPVGGGDAGVYSASYVEYFEGGKVGATAGATADDVESFNGSITAGVPAAGMILHSPSPQTNPFSSICSGTLIGTTTFITAAHCIEANSDLGNFRVLFLDGGVFEIEEVRHLHEKLQGNSRTYAGNERLAHLDIALLHLKRHVTGILPARLTNERQPVGSTSTMVGFGITGYKFSNTGIKRQVSQSVSDCANAPYERPEGLFCWNVLSAASCPGDSGAGHFDKDGALIGVHHGRVGKLGCDNTSGQVMSGQQGAAVRIQPNLGFINGILSEWNGDTPKSTKKTARGKKIGLLGRDTALTVQKANFYCFTPTKDIVCFPPGEANTSKKENMNPPEEWFEIPVPQGTQMLRLGFSAEAEPVSFSVHDGQIQMASTGEPSLFKLEVETQNIIFQNGVPLTDAAGNYQARWESVPCDLGSDGPTQVCEIDTDWNADGHIRYRLKRLNGGGLAMIVLTRWIAN
ncbi:MAG: trypsin-like serine protease [Micropepsaceae bacterium]